jgi:CRISPR type III-B/RAMP module-associated protein Cmr5
MSDTERNLEHERAKYAFDRVERIKGKNDEKAEKKYRSAVLSSGALIHKAGLLQTLAFYLSKPDYRPLAEDILSWRGIKEGSETAPFSIYKNLLTLKDEDIIHKTQEARALVIWLKRFAEGMLKKEQEDAS